MGTYNEKQASIVFASSMYPSNARGSVFSGPFLVGGLDSYPGEREFDPSVLADGFEYEPEPGSNGL